ALRFSIAKRSDASEGPAGEAVQLAGLLAAVGAEMRGIAGMGTKLNIFMLLLRNREHHSDPAQVDTVVSQIVAELAASRDGIQERLKNFVYPFPHARGQLSVAEYARSEKPAENEWQRIYLDCGAHVERLFA